MNELNSIVAHALSIELRERQRKNNRIHDQSSDNIRWSFRNIERVQFNQFENIASTSDSKSLGLSTIGQNLWSTSVTDGSPYACLFPLSWLFWNSSVERISFSFKQINTKRMRRRMKIDDEKTEKKSKNT